MSNEQALEAARRVFLEHGPSVSTDRIAEELGVSAQALFKRFGSKQQLLLAAIRPPDRPPWASLLDDGPDDRPLHDQLTELVDTVSMFFAEMVRRMSLLRWSGVAIEELMREYDPPPPMIGIAALTGWLSRAHDRGLIREADFEATAVALLGSLHAPAFLEDMLGKRPTGLSRTHYVAAIVDLYVHSLSPAPAGDSELTAASAQRVGDST